MWSVTVLGEIVNSILMDLQMLANILWQKADNLVLGYVKFLNSGPWYIFEMIKGNMLSSILKKY